MTVRLPQHCDMVAAVVALLRYRVTAVTAAMNTRGTIITTILVARGGLEKANPV